MLHTESISCTVVYLYAVSTIIVISEKKKMHFTREKIRRTCGGVVNIV